MFYTDTTDNALRFGDVLRGFVISTPNLDNPLKRNIYKLDVEHPDFCVILSPCCSIKDDVVAVSPLINIRNTFFKNPYFKEDLTRINRVMSPENAVIPEVWAQLPEEERQKRLLEGETYAFDDLFIYEANDLFPKYPVHMREGANFETNYYMIDFKNIIKVICSDIKSINERPLAAKLLQLTIPIREELRQKISFYYTRIPEEDKFLED